MNKIYSALALFLLVGTAIPVLAGVGEGQVLYNNFCVICHGPVGEGLVTGKPLIDKGANDLTDLAIIEVIRDGRTGTGMGAWGGSLSETELLDIAGYVRVLQGRIGLALNDEVDAENLDPQVIAGEAVFNGVAGCVSCHSYGETGGYVGPLLDGVSERLGSGLEQALLSPSRDIASGFAVKEVTLSDGTVVRGRFRNDSELAVQIQSADGMRWTSYFKEQVQSVVDSSESLMPDVYATLSEQQQQQLLAFLKTL